METRGKPNRGWSLALLTVGAIGLLLGSVSLFVGSSAPWVLLGGIACLFMGLWIRRETRAAPTNVMILVITIGFFATAAALIGVAVRDGTRGDVGGLLLDVVGAGAAAFVGVRGIRKVRAMRRVQVVRADIADFLSKLGASLRAWSDRSEKIERTTSTTDLPTSGFGSPIARVAVVPTQECARSIRPVEDT
jgi:hypothetical protein